MATDNLFTKKLFAGKKSGCVFLDVGRSNRGTIWIKIGQSRLEKDGRSWKNESVFFFPEQLQELRDALAEAEKAIPSTKAQEAEILFE